MFNVSSILVPGRTGVSPPLIRCSNKYPTRPQKKKVLAVQLPTTTTGATKRRANPVTKKVKTNAAKTPSSTQVTREAKRVAMAKARNRSTGRPAKAI